MLIHDGWNYIQSTAWITASIISLLNIFGRIWPIKLLGLMSLSGIGIWVITLLIFLLLRPRTPQTVAWRVDQDLNLKERFSSAVQLSQKKNIQDPIASVLIDRQRKDTFSTLKSVDPKSAFRLTISLQNTVRTLVISIMAVLLYVLPNPMDVIIQQREETAAAAE